MLSAERARQRGQPFEIGRIGRGNDVDVLRRARVSMGGNREDADQHVVNAGLGERRDQLIGGERPG